MAIWMLDSSVAMMSKFRENYFQLKILYPVNLSVKCKIKLKPIQMCKHRRIKIFCLYFLFMKKKLRNMGSIKCLFVFCKWKMFHCFLWSISMKPPEDILQQNEGEKGEHGFQKAKTPAHENTEGKSRVTASLQPRK